MLKNVLRYLGARAMYEDNATRSLRSLLYGPSATDMVKVDDWIDVACDKIVSGATLRDMCEALDAFLGPRTFFVGHGMTLADLAVFGALCGTYRDYNNTFLMTAILISCHLIYEEEKKRQKRKKELADIIATVLLYFTLKTTIII